MSLNLEERTQQRARQRGVVVGLISLVFIVVLSAVALINAKDGVIDFVRIGTRFSDQNPDGTTGYDGQFSYYIARDGADAVPYIDTPTYRYQRILFPVLARVLSFGNTALIPWVMLVMNITAHAVGAGLLAYLLVLHRAPAFGGLIYAIWIGSIYGVRLSLHEPLCFALALAALVAYTHQRNGWTVALLILSAMTKELGIVIAAGVALHAFFSGRRIWAVVIFGAPLAVFLAWWGVLRLWLGELPSSAAAARGITLIPFAGMLVEEDIAELFLLSLWLVVPTAILFLLALNDIRVKRRLTLPTSLVLFGAAFVMAMPGVSWEDPVAAYRVAIPIVVTGILFVGGTYPRRLKWLAALWMPTLVLALMIPGFWFGNGTGA